MGYKWIKHGSGLQQGRRHWQHGFEAKNNGFLFLSVNWLSLRKLNF